ncbi:FAD/NAD(P)-binding domain-containing protein [Meira miltonrushii]|uniref:FAD/NAD(P)-binding domain-containing protein n=1 Tax=Meira miltonrushii TaxID=1280837 RepID=A0A316VCL4_9BASI|nr:FAD/NAD(P)-binding domain-containing protein [Meira miltonrushii]PWN35407.1 FAD/NAD(P)-binding domain-containing protein [Meira miltonrushii]
MRIAIIGAGFSGITTAKTLRDLGHECIVLEKCSDVGGVWSSSRRYPGLHTQNTKETYCLSDLPMPKHYGQWPNGKQVQEYLEQYIEKNKMKDLIHLNTEVINVKRANHKSPLTAGVPWIITVQGDLTPIEADHLIVCTGIFSDGDVPRFEGLHEFEAQGGKVCHTSAIGANDNMKGKDVVVVGYGKSACDVANAAAEQGIAKEVTLVARRLIWKVPRKIRGLTYKWLLLTRMGEALFEYIRPGNIVESFFHRTWIGSKIRNGMMDSLEWVISGQLGLKKIDLVPRLAFETVAQSTISLSTEGLYDKVRQGRLTIKRDNYIVKLAPSPYDPKQWGAYLSSGSFVPADLILCGTGFHQKPPAFLPDEIAEQLLDKRGYWFMYRHIKPFGVPDLTFNGFGSSLFSATSSEASALWIGAYLSRGESMLPSEKEQKRITQEKLEWLEVRCQGKHSNGTNVVPFSMHTIDEVLDEAKINIGKSSKLLQWVFPINPTYYSGLSHKLANQLAKENGNKKNI